MSRPVDAERRAQLLDAVVAYAVEHGFADLSWRPVAAGVGVSPTALVHRFGSKEQMLQEIQRHLREQILAETTPGPDREVSLAEFARTVWDRTSDPRRAGEFRLFFATYGQALQAPGRFGDFLAHVVADLHASLQDRISGSDPAEAETKATVVIATLRGLLLDLLTTGATARVHAAADAFIASLTETPATDSV